MLAVSDLKGRILGLLNERFKETDYYVVEVSVTLAGNGLISVLADRDSGINLDDCAGISRFLGRCLEDDVDLQGPYRLEVSSPGLGRPLTIPRQYVNKQGKILKIHLHNGELIQGRLESVNVSGLKVDIASIDKRKKIKIGEIGVKGVDFSDIKESSVIVSIN